MRRAKSLSYDGIQDPAIFAKFWRLSGELTTQLPRVGWGGIGFRRHEMDTLAAHHYNVELLTLIFGLEAIRLRKAKINIASAGQEATIHDLSEFGGGDIGVPRASEFPALKIASRRVEEVNRAALATILGKSAGKKYMDLALDEMNQTSDEARLVKFADRIEALLHLHRIRPQKFTEDDAKYYENSIRPTIDAMQDHRLRIFCYDLLDAFIEEHKEGKLGPIVERCEDTLSNYRRIVRLANELQRTKETPRTGWVMGGLSAADTDTISDHGHVTAIGLTALSWNLEEAGIAFDGNMAHQLALNQEIGKLYGADISPISDELHKAGQGAAHEIRRTTSQILWSTIDHDLAQYLRYMHDPSLAASSEGTSNSKPAPPNALNLAHEEAIGRATDTSRVVLAMSRMADHIHYDLHIRPERYGQDHRIYVKRKIIGIAERIEDATLRDYMIKLLIGLDETVTRKQLRGPISNLVVPTGI